MNMVRKPSESIDPEISYHLLHNMRSKSSNRELSIKSLLSIISGTLNLLSPHDRARRAMNYVMEISLTKWIYPDILNSRTSSGL